MPNGKGWLDCFDCVHQKRDFQEKFSTCLRHNFIIPEIEEVDYRHRFCSSFIANKDQIKILNGDVRKEHGVAYYYVYKPESEFYNSSTDKKIKLNINILYGYYYMNPSNIEEIIKIHN